MQPPDCSGCHSVHSGCTMQHRQYRRDADAGADKDDGGLTGRQREGTARSADLQAAARPDALVEKAAREAMLILDGNPVAGFADRTAQGIVPSDGGCFGAWPHADHDVLAG